MTETSPRPVDFAHLEGHKNIVLMFSGGKDSLALIYLFRDFLARITVLHLDAGDLLPEVRELVASVEKTVPHFVRLRTDAHAWIKANGIPSSLVPVRWHPILRSANDGGGPSIVPPFDCCRANRWQPIGDYVEKERPSLVIHGQRHEDLVPALFWQYDKTPAPIERWAAIATWTDSDVFDYLDEVGAPILPFYKYHTHAPECATCPADWDEGRGAYLKKHHPDLADRYASYLRIHAAAMAPIAEQFMAEWRALGLGSSPSSQAEFD